ncbi:dienelactone hydrolase family protein [Flavobacterium sp. W21_SRS_FM6]|uniref:dienelactone hydrolase family protein n=1 Tax=Flavobacterium sp. W21_SRS_FM6 TaxID=3240268 RepID=UPI003F910F68
MHSNWITIKQQGDNEYSGYLSLPPSGKGPGLILLQEIWGVNEHIQAVADQYALAGYVVLAPDIFWQFEHRVSLNYDDAGNQQAFDYYSKMDFADAALHIKDAVATLRSLPAVTAKVGVVGYCMGGQLAYRTAAGSQVDAAVCYYGGGIDRCLELSEQLTLPIMFHYAKNDSHISQAAVSKVKSAFKDKAKAIFYDYADTEHGFNCWGRPAMFNQKASALALGRTLTFLSEHL